jgi:hypothetical protein
LPVIRYHEPLELLCAKLFSFRGTTTQRLSARAHVAKSVEHVTDADYERKMRDLEAAFVLRQVKDLALVHLREVRDRMIDKATSSQQRHAVSQATRKSTSKC